MDLLFDDPDKPKQAPAMQVVAVALAANVWRTFDYGWPASLPCPQVGMRVRVPFGRGNRPTLGIVTQTDRAAGQHKLKNVTAVVDQESQFDSVHWKLGQWISQYYLTPLGMTLAAMIPSAVGKHGAKSETVVYLTSEPADWPKSLGARQKRVLDELYEARKQGVESLPMQSLLAHSECSRDTITRLKNRDFLRLDSRPVVLPDMNEATEEDTIELSADQQAVLGSLVPKLSQGFSSTLLYGVTGSGKTEVYVRAIRKVIEAGKQAIVLVPEIALATQTLQRLVKRLPRVAVLHSGLTDVQRAFYFQQIRDGHASVVVGPRSAVFAPARNLGLIVVDEEHEPSYKQDTVPRYHGRDVAVKLASLADVPVVLGSATPSLESMRNVKEGRYEMLRLPRRVRGLPMPKLKIVNLRQDLQRERSRVELIGMTLTHHLAATLDRRQQAILLMNRRGFASYVFCPKCQWEMYCEQCTRTMVFHQATQMVMCHYCQHTAALPDFCPACQGKLLLFGMGIQRIEEELARKFPEARVARMDSDTMTSPKQFQKVFDAFSAGELDVLLGTQMVAKGLDFPRVSLVGVLSADTSLSIPDFRASERTFQLICQVSGRAGRADVPGQVVVQTLHAEEPAIIFAGQNDFDGFAENELALRNEAMLPPYARMVRFLVRHEKVDRADEGAQQLAQILRTLLPTDGVLMMGPQQAGIIKIRNQFRFEILLTLRQPGLVQQIIGPRMEQICRDIPAEIIADIDPMNLV